MWGTKIEPEALLWSLERKLVTKEKTKFTITQAHDSRTNYWDLSWLSFRMLSVSTFGKTSHVLLWQSNKQSDLNGAGIGADLRMVETCLHKFRGRSGHYFELHHPSALVSHLTGASGQSWSVYFSSWGLARLAHQSMHLGNSVSFWWDLVLHH